MTDHQRVDRDRNMELSERFRAGPKELASRVESTVQIARLYALNS